MDKPLIQRLSRYDFLDRAWAVVKKNRFAAPGLDRLSVEDFDSSKRKHLSKILSQIKDGSYSFNDALKKSIPKSSGHGTRDIHVFSMRDKVVQQAIQAILIGKYEQKDFFPE